MKCTLVARPKQLINSSPNYKPSLADEITEPCPDINIRVTACTVSKSSIILGEGSCNVLTSKISCGHISI